MVSFPFSDKPTQVKERTALIISKDSINTDKVILAYITSTIKNKTFGISIPLDVQKPASLTTCEIRTNRLFTADKNIIIRKVCSLDKTFLNKILVQISSHII